MPLHFLSGDGAMGEAIRRYDWSGSPLGPPEQWSATLKTIVATVLGSRFPQCIVWGAEKITIYNDAFRPILGKKPEALGRPFSEVWAEAWDEIGPIAESAFAGEATFIEDFPLVVHRNGYAEQTWFTFCYSPIRDEAGQVVGMLDTVIETTGKMQAERQARLLNLELSHRMKNMLAVVQAIANRTFRSESPLTDARRSFDERIAALGSAHDILTQANWSDAPVAAIVGGALRPHISDPDAASIDGPPVYLGGRQALSLALAIHELATNAAKYGALSTDNGRVSVRWAAGDPGSDDPFVLTWEEKGGPPPSPPTLRGFGSQLIERILPQDFGGKVTVGYPAEGYRCELRTRMSGLQEREKGRKQPKPGDATKEPMRA